MQPPKLELARSPHDGYTLPERLRRRDNGSATLSTIFKIISTVVLRNAAVFMSRLWVAAVGVATLLPAGAVVHS